MSDRRPLPTWYFAMVVVRHGDRFALVREKKHGQLWYFPAGRVEPGETLTEAAVRETKEEAGIDVALTGLLRVEHSPQPGGSVRCRVFFVAEPKGDARLKSEPDEHSLEARWVTIEELDALPLRGEEVLDCFRAVRDGAPVAPLSMLTDEGAPW
ncbi:MAG: NUDIX domain-containing protein [Myxococcales bacterium]|nr:NUDIX domain-containing protein [Myxococcales bacterium]